MSHLRCKPVAGKRRCVSGQGCLLFEKELGRGGLRDILVGGGAELLKAVEASRDLTNEKSSSIGISGAAAVNCHALPGMCPLFCPARHGFSLASEAGIDGTCFMVGDANFRCFKLAQ